MEFFMQLGFRAWHYKEDFDLQYEILQNAYNSNQFVAVVIRNCL